MNRTKLLTAAVTGLLLINIATLGVLVFRRPHHPPQENPAQPGEGPKRAIIERLHFDTQQQKEYQVLIDDHQQKMRALNEMTRSLHDKLFMLLKADQADRVKADSLIQLIADNQKATEQLNFDHFTKIKGLCRGKQVNGFNAMAEDLGMLFAPKGRPR